MVFSFSFVLNISFWTVFIRFYFLFGPDFTFQERTEEDVHPKKITKLAIGVEGGFNPDAPKNYRLETSYAIVILPDFIEIAYPNDCLPEKVKHVL